MRDAMFAYEPFIRLGAFGGVFTVMVIWELVGPRCKQAIGRGMRWPSNLGVVMVDTLLVRLVIPARGRVHGEIVDVAGQTEARFVGWRNLVDALRRVARRDATADDQEE